MSFSNGELSSGYCSNHLPPIVAGLSRSQSHHLWGKHETIPLLASMVFLFKLILFFIHHCSIPETSAKIPNQFTQFSVSISAVSSSDHGLGPLRNKLKPRLKSIMIQFRCGQKSVAQYLQKLKLWKIHQKVFKWTSSSHRLQVEFL